MELGLASGVTVQPEPKMIDETKEPQEFFEGKLHAHNNYKNMYDLQ